MDSTTLLDTVAASDSAKETKFNALVDAMSQNALFGRRASTTAALTWGYYGGKYRKADGTILEVANGTVALTASQTNYILETDGVVSKVTAAPSGWPGPLAAGANALYQIVCDASGVNPAAWPTGGYKDYRTPNAPPVAADVSIADAGTYFTGTSVEAALQEIGADLAVQPVLLNFFYPGAPTASVLVGIFAAPASIPTITFAAAISGSAGKALTAATAQTDIDVRKNATTSSNGSSVGTVRFAAAGTVPTFIAASGFTLTGGTDYLTLWAPASPDATLANIGIDLAGTR